MNVKMKNFKKYILGAGMLVAGAASMTSCIEETLPTDDRVTEEQLQATASAAKALCMAMPANFNFQNFFDSWVDDVHYCFGYGSFMRIRDIMTGDFCENTTNYSHFYRWAQNQFQGQDYRYGQYFWNYYYGFILTANNVISAVDPNTATDEQKGYYAAGLAYRAMLYLDLARMYEFLPNDKTSPINADGMNVQGLTVPIIKAGMTAQEAASNPRATHEEMFKFIEQDLLEAEQYIVYLDDTQNHSLPDLGCVQGLLARLYMWEEQYEKAYTYADRAIDHSSVQPISKERYTDTKTGMNQASDFMWASNITADDWCVKTGIVNWVSWMSNQTDFGYTGPSTSLYCCVDRSMYDRMSNSDFRKTLFKAPAGSILSGSEPWLMKSMAGDEVPAYVSIKFRPGSGEVEEYSTGAVVSYPIMRVEEMYFIRAEAKAHTEPEVGMGLCREFMLANRDPQYKFNSADQDEIIDEIVFQKRVELWGEGQTFFDIKRLNMSVTRGYEGTNFVGDARLNTEGRPAWMNLVIVQTEGNNNEAVKLYNNPDPSDLYTPWTPEN